MSDDLEARLALMEARVAELSSLAQTRRKALEALRARLVEARRLLAAAEADLEVRTARKASARAQYVAVEARCYEHLKGGVEVLLRHERKR